MELSIQYLAFTLDERHYAIVLSAIEKVVHAVHVTSLPGAPEIVLGVINIQGRIIPVVNIRKRFGLSEREIGLTDRFIIAATSRRPVALVVDSVIGTIEPAREDVTPAEKITPGMEYIGGVIRLDSGMILIHNLDRFLSLEEETMLDRAEKKVKKKK